MNNQNPLSAICLLLTKSVKSRTYLYYVPNRQQKVAKGETMENIFIRIQDKESSRYYAFTQSVTGTLDFIGKTEKPDISDYQEIDGSTYFSPTWYTYLPKALQAEIHILFRDSANLTDANLFAYLTHIGAVLLAVEQKDGLLVAELLHRRTQVFFQFLPLTLYIIKSIAPLALFAWLYGRFSHSSGFQKMFEQGILSPTADTAEILFASAREELSPEHGKETVDEMFIRYLKQIGHGEFTIGTVGSDFHVWNSKKAELESFLKEAIGKDFLRGESLVRERKEVFYSELKVSVQAEPYNPYDPNAISVAIEDISGKLFGNGGKSKAGYIRATGAAILRRAFPGKFAYQASLARLGTNLSEGNNNKDGIVLRIHF